MQSSDGRSRTSSNQLASQQPALMLPQLVQAAGPDAAPAGEGAEWRKGRDRQHAAGVEFGTGNGTGIGDAGTSTERQLRTEVEALKDYIRQTGGIPSPDSEDASAPSEREADASAAGAPAPGAAAATAGAAVDLNLEYRLG